MKKLNELEIYAVTEAIEDYINNHPSTNKPEAILIGLLITAKIKLNEGKSKP